jgi:hypothetical protein
MSRSAIPTSAKLISRPAAVKTVTDAHQISRNRRDRGTGLRNEYILGRVGRDFSVLGQCSGMSPEAPRQFSDQSPIRCRCAARPEVSFLRLPSGGAVADPVHEKGDKQGEAGNGTYPGGEKSRGKTASIKTGPW